jgi:hypothetical protein
MRGWTMGTERARILGAAGFLLIVAALGYLGLILLAIPNGEVYLAGLEGNRPTSVWIVAVAFGPLAFFALVLAREVLARRVARLAIAGFVAWFLIAALDAILIDIRIGVGIGLTGVVPLGLASYGTRARS